MALTPLSAVFDVFVFRFAIIMSPAFAGFEMGLSLPVEGKRKDADDADEQDLTQIFI